MVSRGSVPSPGGVPYALRVLDDRLVASILDMALAACEGPLLPPLLCASRVVFMRIRRLKLRLPCIRIATGAGVRQWGSSAWLGDGSRMQEVLYGLGRDVSSVEVRRRLRGGRDRRRDTPRPTLMRRAARCNAQVPETMVGAVVAYVDTLPPSELLVAILWLMLYGVFTTARFSSRRANAFSAAHARLRSDWTVVFRQLALEWFGAPPSGL